MNRTVLSALFVAIAPLAAQQPPKPIVSPEVNADRTVTFRFRAPNAKEVFVAREGADKLAMQKDDEGVWSAITPTLEPDMYGYSFLADGVSLIDPNNSLMKPNLLFTTSMVHVPGSTTLPWEVADVPHGTVHHHYYHSGIVGDNRDFFVYTPPNYDPKAKKAYPVLYLLHGYSDDASGWTAVGRANYILDNLIAQGKAKPMIVVMPLGYGAPEIVARGFGGFRDNALRMRNFDRFREALTTEVLPAVEKSYNVAKDRNSRAIAGLSMGGAESLYTGLNNIDKFAYVGAFSSGGLNEGDLATAFPKLDAKSASQLRLLWVACGKEDRLIEFNRKFLDWAETKGVKFTRVETPGAHTWMVWRRNLSEFAPLLFTNNAS